jgi:hypothetical protein
VDPSPGEGAAEDLGYAEIRECLLRHVRLLLRLVMSSPVIEGSGPETAERRNRKRNLTGRQHAIRAANDTRGTGVFPRFPVGWLREPTPIRICLL